MSLPLAPLTYFHAGALFNLKELAGNALMARAILQESQGRYRAILPQDLELQREKTTSIRDSDLLALLRADVALFHFDGTELDSGTVVEFMVAKFADIPAVLLRTDFRRAGDSADDAWNLMLSDYPRTRQVIVHAMELYHQQLHPEKALENAAEQATHETARRVITAFDEVMQMPAVLPDDLREAVYRWIALFPGFDLSTSDIAGKLDAILKAKNLGGTLKASIPSPAVDRKIGFGIT
jgi:nucleoside 2-deoxyribosyltransferase